MTKPLVTKITTNIRIPTMLRDQLHSYAGQAGMSVNSAIIATLDRGLRDLGFPGLVIDPELRASDLSDAQ